MCPCPDLRHAQCRVLLLAVHRRSEVTRHFGAGANMMLNVGDARGRMCRVQTQGTRRSKEAGKQMLHGYYGA